MDFDTNSLTGKLNDERGDIVFDIKMAKLMAQDLPPKPMCPIIAMRLAITVVADFYTTLKTLMLRGNFWHKWRRVGRTVTVRQRRWHH